MEERRLPTDSAENPLMLQAQILDRVAEAIIALDCGGRIVFWNRPAEELFHVSAAAALGKMPKEVNVYPWLTPEDEEDALLAVIGTGIWRGEAARLEASGKVKYIESTITPLNHADGDRIGMVATLRDITTVKHKEIEHEECINRLRATLNRLKIVMGLVPICSHCKQIRDEHGVWHAIDNYLGERFPMRFSHGICPACAQKFYRHNLGEPGQPG